MSEQIASMEKVKEALGKLDFKVLKKRAVEAFDVRDIPSEHLGKIVHIACHCAMNGPVGVGKTTTFPGLNYNGSIKDLLPDVTNSKWRGFVDEVVRYIPREDEAVRTCYTVLNFKNLWPICDSTFRAKPKENENK